MTAPISAVLGVHTDDAVPDAAKFRISDKAGHDTAIVTVDVNPGNAPLRPGAGVRPGVGVRPGAGAFDVGGAYLGGDLVPGMAPYVAAMVMTKGTLRSSKPVAALGVVCGMTRCGAEGARPLRVVARRVGGGPATVPVHSVSGVVKWSELQLQPDGDVPVNVFALVEPEGWL